MNIDQEFTSGYLTAAAVDGWGRPAKLTIRAVTIETLGRGQDAQRKPVVAFHEITEAWALNVSNRGRMKELFGPETETWIGQHVVLETEPGTFQGRAVRQITCRLPRVQAPPHPPMPSAPMPAPRAPIFSEVDHGF